MRLQSAQWNIVSKQQLQQTAQPGNMTLVSERVLPRQLRSVITNSSTRSRSLRGNLITLVGMASISAPSKAVLRLCLTPGRSVTARGASRCALKYALLLRAKLGRTYGCCITLKRTAYILLLQAATPYRSRTTATLAL